MNRMDLENHLAEGADPDPAPAPETAVDPDGWVYDVATGEVLGHQEVDPYFAVMSTEAADWVLRLRSKIEGDLAGIDARIRALTAQLQALRSAQVRRLSWWDWRFSAELVAFARTTLRGKSRTAHFAWGKVAFRRNAGTHQILDMAEAVAWVKDWAPERVKVVESVAVKDVLAAIEVVARATGEEPDRPPFLQHIGGGETATVSTGIVVGTNHERGGP
jgi:phage host-nuclease inhibitor protein Gam